MLQVRQVILIYIFLFTVLAPAVALADGAATTGGKTPAASELNWVDVETGKTLFSLADIVRFDWQRQIVELSPDKATALLSLVVQRRDFVVKDHEGVIYYGRFYRSVSSEGYDGATILIDQGPLKKLPASPFFTIAGGYPNGGGAHDHDRFSPRLQNILKTAGVLGSITDAEMPIERVWSGHTWVGGEEVVKASAVLFPTTFRVAKSAYLHLFLSKTPKAAFDFDQLQVEVTCTSADGRFVAKQQVLSIAPPLLDNGIYICKFQPWNGIQTPPPADDVNRPPTLKTIEQPRYPKNALNEDREGTVIIAVTVAADGKISATDTVKGSGSNDIDKAAMRAVTKCAFLPALVAGKATTGSVLVQFVFASRKVSVSTVPLQPVPATAKPGPMSLSIKIIGLKKDGDTLKPLGVWTLPTRMITLMPETPAPAATPVK